jgi:hypothetical protein
VVFCASVVPARALVVAPPPPGPQRLAKVDCIVVGRIIAIEGKDIQVLPEKTDYRIAVISVTEAIKRTSEKTLRLGFIAPAVNQPGGGLIRRPIRRYSPIFEVGQDGLFFLTKHAKGPFYTAPMYYDFVSSQNGNFAHEVKQTRLILKWGNNPATGLRSRDAGERFIAASILIGQYRQPMGPVTKTEPINAQESKLILHALREADWKQNQGPSNPWNMFLRLGLTNKDGWEFPKGPNLQQEDFHRAAQKWLSEHADSYRIQRLVGGARGRPVGTPIRPVPVQGNIRIQPVPIQVEPIADQVPRDR